ncbi:hypothetical protein SFUMM280S_05509 [Streptomyces fumanus]
MDSVIRLVASAIRHSVYRMAAGGSSLPSEPKLPWPSTRGTRMENGWAMRTRAS